MRTLGSNFISTSVYNDSTLRTNHGDETPIHLLRTYACARIGKLRPAMHKMTRTHLCVFQILDLKKMIVLLIHFNSKNKTLIEV